MATANLTAYNAATKQTWTEDTLYDQLFQGDDLLTRIETTRKFQVGRQAVTPIHVSRNSGYTALAAGGGTLNAAGNQGSKQAIWNYTNHHQQIALEGELIDGTVNDTLAVVNAIDEEINGGLMDLRRQLSRQVVTNGDAVIATMGTTTSATTVVLEPISGKNAIDRGWLFVNAVVDIGTVANPVLRAAGVAITAIDPVGLTFTVASAITTATTDQVSYKGSRVAGPVINEMNGLHNVVSQTTTLGTLTVAGESTWVAANADNTSQALTLNLIYDNIRLVQQKIGARPDTIWSGYKQNERLYQLLQTQVHYAGDAPLTTGTMAVSVGGVPVEAQYDIKDQEMYFLTMKDLFMCAIDKPYWQNKLTGGEILAWIQGTDSFGAKITYRLQLCCRRRNSQACLTNLS